MSINIQRLIGFNGKLNTFLKWSLTPVNLIFLHPQRNFIFVYYKDGKVLSFIVVEPHLKQRSSNSICNVI